MIATLLVFAALTAPPSAVVVEQKGDTLHVTKVPPTWREGMPVVVLWQPIRGARPSVVAQGRVEAVVQSQAVVRLDSDRVVISDGAHVMARHRYERARYGGGSRGVTASSVAAALAQAVKHRPPAVARWGEPLFFEAMVATPLDRLEVMLRLGRRAPYQAVELTQRKDRYYAGEFALGPAQPSVEVIQYYLVGTKGGVRVALRNDPAAPQTLKLETAPKTDRTKRVAHERVARWTEGEALPISAELDDRLTKPMLHYRLAGSGRTTQVPMTKVGERLFEASIPAARVVRPTLSYYLSALTPKGTRVAVKGSAARPLQVKVLRHRLLDGTRQRNGAQVRFDWINRGVAGDASQRKDMLYERAFFPYLVARIGFLLWDEERLAAQVVGGQAGVELRFGEFLSLTGDARTLAFGEGSAFGYRFGAQIGDEAGASIGGSYGYSFDLETAAPVGESLSFQLRVPVAKRYQLAGVFESDDYFAAEKDLRLYTRVAAQLGRNVQISGSAGMATRGGERSGLYFGASTGFGF